MTIAENIKKRAATLSFPSQAFIDGKFTAASSGKTFECISPIDGKLLTKIAECDQEDVNRAVKAARRVFEKGSWATMAPKARKAIMLKWVELANKNAEELALLETLDVGKPINESRNSDVAGALDCLQWYAETCDKVYDELAPARPDSISMITREPTGVVGAVIPWNFPLLLACWKLGPALATGNSVLLKPAEQSPLTALKMAQLAAEAGLPEGVLNVLPGFGATTGQAMGRHMDIDMLCFTGSTEVGKYFLTYSGESNMKAVSLETGGKSPNIIFADANLEKAAAAAAAGIYYNAGQVCTAASRLLIDAKIADEFIKLVEIHAKDWQPQNPLDSNTLMGAMIDDKQMKSVLDYINIGKGEAKLIFGGNQTRQETGGYYIEPTLFRGDNNKLRIACEEIFGPVLVAIPFAEEAQAIQLANDTIYGLQASLWTNNLSRAHNVARQLRAGTVNINNIDGGDITVPFGGFKQSGIGRDKSLHALAKYQQLKHTFIQL